MMRALPAWNRELPGYGFTLGMQAFGLEECGDYRRAEETGRHAIELEPDDCWAQHALAHVLEMEARQAEGIAFMESRRDHWAQDDNGFAFHNWWHMALYNLDQDHIERALEIHDRSIRPGQSEIQLEMLDATALLWRMHLRGIDVGKRWENLAAAYEKTAQDGFYAFNDMHAMIAYVATGRREAAKRLLAGAARAAEKSGTNARMEREVGLPVMRGIEAFGRGQYGATVELLMPVRYRAHVFGGSHAQRDIIHRTLVEAALRDSQFALANALATERTQLKPHCPFSWQLRLRAEAGIAGRA
jgi:tetratricopeptide (TPR) repeat protein